MQTFLPYPDFLKSAQVLDKKRCWKQVVEAKQIISILSHLEECPKDNVPWKNHPAVKMWENHIPELAIYFNSFLNISIDIHKINTKYDYYRPIFFYGKRAFVHDSIILNFPFWLGNEDFHRSHRARLIEKDRDFYLPSFPNDERFNDGKYLWPDMETKTFKII